MKLQSRIIPFLWFDSDAQAAAELYTSIFPNSSIGRIGRFSEEGYEIHKRPAGSVMTVEFVLDGMPFTALNGGPEFRFSEAVSFQVMCADQEEVDYFWERLGEGGDERAKQCGWLKDRFGLSWQIIPEKMFRYILGEDPEGARRATRAMLSMKKLELAELERAYAGEERGNKR